MDNPNEILIRNKIFYEFFLHRKLHEVAEVISAEETVERIVFLAKFAWRNHAGYYFDGRLENRLVEYGRDLCQYIDQKRVTNLIDELLPGETNFTLLHVATELGSVGGHTRVLYQIIQRYRDGKQILVLTDQAIKNVPEWFVDGLAKSIKIISLHQIKSPFERSFLLRHISIFCGTTISYHHPYDVVPVMAFSHDRCPPVLVENHAHSWFWLGTSVADSVFSHSPFHHNFTIKTRSVNNAYFLPCTQIDDLGDMVTREDKITAKSRLGLDSDTVCIITIGTSEKFIPNAQYNFFKTAKKIVDRYNKVRLFIIGLPEDPKLRNEYNLDAGKIHFVGPVSDPSSYYKAADICLDALPQPSLGGTWFSTLIGMSCPLYKYGAGNIFNSRNFIDAKLYADYIGDMRNEEEYLGKLGLLINNPELRLEIAREFREQYLTYHAREVFNTNFKKMLDFAGNMTHQHRRIPDGIFHQDADSTEIAGASYFQDLSSVFDHFRKSLSIRDKINIIFLLSIRFVLLVQILQLLVMSVRSRILSLYHNCIKSRRLTWPD
jgi:glycosyltransferase involved in cell wall biosynthesis